MFDHLPQKTRFVPHPILWLLNAFVKYAQHPQAHQQNQWVLTTFCDQVWSRVNIWTF